MHSEVELGVQVGPGRRRPRALAQQQRGRPLGQAAAARVLHEPALDGGRPRRDGARQACERGALRAAGGGTRPLCPCRAVGRGHPTSLPPAPLGFRGKEAGARSPKATARSRDRGSMAPRSLQPQACRSPFTFSFLQLPARGRRKSPPRWHGGRCIPHWREPRLNSSLVRVRAPRPGPQHLPARHNPTLGSSHLLPQHHAVPPLLPGPRKHIEVVGSQVNRPINILITFKKNKI